MDLSAQDMESESDGIENLDECTRRTKSLFSLLSVVLRCVDLSRVMMETDYCREKL